MGARGEEFKGARNAAADGNGGEPLYSLVKDLAYSFQREEGQTSGKTSGSRERFMRRLF